jgi:hypothetical protein
MGRGLSGLQRWALCKAYRNHVDEGRAPVAAPIEVRGDGSMERAEQLYDACEALGIQPSYVRGGAWRPAVITDSSAHKLARRLLLLAMQAARIKGHGERYPVPHPDQARRLVDAAQGLQAGK